MINIGLITSKQAKRQPNAWAVYDNTSQRRITFKELDDLVNQLEIYPKIIIPTAFKKKLGHQYLLNLVVC